MGKVRDEAPAKTSKPAPKGQAIRDARRRIAPFVANLFRADLVKPNQGRHARLWTGVGLALLVVAGIYRLYQTALADMAPLPRYGIPLALALACGWLIFRVIQYGPFADFLIATEAEMNKVSWTSRDDLYRATMVVLLTVLFMAVYLFGVDWAWSTLLKLIGVLRFTDTAGLGSQAG